LVQTYQNVKNIPNDHKLYQKAKIIPNGCKIFQMVIKYNNSFHSKALQILPKLGFLVWKQTIWQPCQPVVQIWGGERFLCVGEISWPVEIR
jgi:hypothetical protein